jgi:hypothetical protein
MADNPFWHVLVTAIAPLSFRLHRWRPNVLIAAAGPIALAGRGRRVRESGRRRGWGEKRRRRTSWIGHR